MHDRVQLALEKAKEGARYSRYIIRHFNITILIPIANFHYVRNETARFLQIDSRILNHSSNSNNHLYDAKENLEMSMHNQFDYSYVQNGNYYHGDAANMYPLASADLLDMQSQSNASNNSNSTASFVITKPRAPRRISAGGKWNKEEDDQLRAIVHQHGAKNWKKVPHLTATAGC